MPVSFKLKLIFWTELQTVEWKHAGTWGKLWVKYGDRGNKKNLPYALGSWIYFWASSFLVSLCLSWNEKWKRPMTKLSTLWNKYTSFERRRENNIYSQRIQWSSCVVLTILQAWLPSLLLWRVPSNFLSVSLLEILWYFHCKKCSELY